MSKEASRAAFYGTSIITPESLGLVVVSGHCCRKEDAPFVRAINDSRPFYYLNLLIYCDFLKDTDRENLTHGIKWAEKMCRWPEGIPTYHPVYGSTYDCTWRVVDPVTSEQDMKMSSRNLPGDLFNVYHRGRLESFDSLWAAFYFISTKYTGV